MKADPNRNGRIPNGGLGPFVVPGKYNIHAYLNWPKMFDGPLKCWAPEHAVMPIGSVAKQFCRQLQKAQPS